ncbi:MAG: hypothetical protein QGH25_15355, partial [Candidatus Latescibacteria bacterium]|nr:hypothetical protein [Candidatus Latescibacterota bacterium]
KDAFISLSLTLVDTGWRQVKAFFEASAKALPRVEPTQRLRFLQMAEKLLVGGATNLPSTMLEISEAMHDLDRKCHGLVLDMADRAHRVIAALDREILRVRFLADTATDFVQASQYLEEVSGLESIREKLKAKTDASGAAP